METVFLKTRFDLFRNGESMQLTHDVVKACTDADAAKLKIDAETTELKKTGDSADIAFDGITGSSLTEEIIGLDHLRDDDIIGIKGVATGFAKHYSQNIKLAGKTVISSLDKYSKRIDKENLATETTIIRNWYGDIASNADLKDAITLLGLKDWADHLNSCNESFNTKYVQRSQELGNKEQLDSVGDLLPTLKKKYSSLLDQIAALHTLDKGKGTYTALINQINALIKQYNTRAKARTGAANSNTKPADEKK